MSYLLDTNVCIRLLNDANSPNWVQMRRLQPSDIVLCDVVKAELYYGVEKSHHRERNRATLESFFTHFVSVPFESQSASIFGSIKAYLTQRGTPIGAYDLLIAAIALAYDHTVVTNNLGEFQRIPNLRVESWESKL